MKTTKYILAGLCALPLCSVALLQEQKPALALEDKEDLPILQENSARIVLTLPKTKYVGGEHIQLDVGLKNVGTKPFTFIPMDADRFYQIEVIEPDGNKAPLLGTHTRRTENGGHGGVSPGYTKTMRVWLSNLFDMTMEGEYIITVSKRFRLGKDVLTVKSDPIKLDVTSTPVISEWQ